MTETTVRQAEGRAGRLRCTAAAACALLVWVCCPLSGAPPERPKDTGKCSLWEVTSGKARVYLLGTLHVFKKEFYPLDETIDKAYASADCVAMELSLSKANEAKAQQLVARMGLLPVGRTLEQVLPPQTYAKAMEYARRAGYGRQQVSRLRPWLLGVLIEKSRYSALGYSPRLGLDRHFYDTAVADKKPIIELETVQQQLLALSAGSNALQARALAHDLDRMPALAEHLRDLTAAWTAGDVEALERVLHQGRSDSPELRPLYEKMYDERNARMAEKIAKLLDADKTCFVMVGSAHLVGKKGLLKLLRQNGHQVRQCARAAAGMQQTRPSTDRSARNGTAQ